ncbi:MAG: hypothetical protein ABEJ87_04990 [Candidatus Nanohalobium sp.]
MSEKTVMDLVEIEKTRGEINITGKPHGLHCEYYSVYWQKTIERAELVDGETIIRDNAREALFEELGDVFTEKDAEHFDERREYGEEFFRAIGYGKFHLPEKVDEGLEVTVENSHFGQGWKKQWGEQEETKCTAIEGFLEGFLAAATVSPQESFEVREKQCIAQGADKCTFEVVEDGR